MADVKISALPAADAITGAETLVVIQSAATKKTTVDDVATYLGNSVPFDPTTFNVNASSGTPNTQSGYGNIKFSYNSEQEGNSNTQFGSGNTQSGYYNLQAGRNSTQSGYNNYQTGISNAQTGQYGIQGGSNLDDGGFLYTAMFGLAKTAAVDQRAYFALDNGIWLKPVAAPSTPEAGVIYYDSGTNKLRVYTGAGWETVTSA